MLVVLANCIKQCKCGFRDRHSLIVGVLKTIPMVFLIIGLSLTTAAIEGGDAMIGAFAINIASHFAVVMVGGQSKYSHFIHAYLKQNDHSLR